jgi:outer membrane protein TolC
MAQLRELDGELKIYKENEKLYRDLVKSTEDGIKSGTNTQLDLEMMKNSYRIALLQQKIVDLKRQKVLLELDYQLYTYRNRLDPTIDSDSPHLSFNLKGER